MKNKKLIIINLFVLIAFVFVVGAGIYRADTTKDEFAETEKKPDVQLKESEEEKLEISEKEEEAELLTPTAFIIKPTIGKKALQQANFLSAEETNFEDEVAEDLEDTFEEVETETDSAETSNESNDSVNTWNSSTPNFSDNNVKKESVPKKPAEHKETNSKTENPTNPDTGTTPEEEINDPEEPVSPPKEDTEKPGNQEEEPKPEEPEAPEQPDPEQPEIPVDPEPEDPPTKDPNKPVEGTN